MISFKVESDGDIPKIKYGRLFFILLMSEVLLESVGYQRMGLIIYGKMWSSEQTWEPYIHLIWLIVINTPVLYGVVTYLLKRQRRYLLEIRNKDRNVLALFHHNPNAVFTIDINGRLKNINRATEQMLGYSLKELQSIDDRRLSEVLGIDISLIRQNAASLIKETHRKIECVSKGDRLIVCEAQFVSYYEQNNIVGLFIIAKDVTEQLALQERMKYLANFDHLSGLPNRRFFTEQINQILSQPQSPSDKYAVLFIDLDRFKYINDALGHSVGDEVLKIISRRITNSIGDKDIAARFGGDEFMIFMPNISGVEEVKKQAEWISKNIKQKIPCNEYEFYLTSSIGIAIYPVSGDSVEDLIKNADAAMYEAKHNGKNQTKLHMPSFQNYTYNRFQLESELRKALVKDDELYVEYQPQIDVFTDEVVSAEALIRWRHPIIGLIPPNEFIPLAEETGLIIDLGKYVFNAVCQQIKKWTDQGEKIIPVGLNVSLIEIQHDHFIQNFKQVLNKYHIAPALLAIEITETTLMRDEENIKVKLRELRALGISIHIDDFGKGYSSLGFLKQLPIDVLKIDQIFVKDLDKGYQETAIISALISLAHSRNLKVIAEGVETENQLITLKNNHCDQYQGYYFSKPVSSASFVSTFLRNSLSSKN